MFYGIGSAMNEAVEQILASEAAVAAVLHWRQVTYPPGYDEEDESSQEGATQQAMSLEFRCLFHQVDHRLSGFQRFMEVETGDVIIDYAADLGLGAEGREDERIEVDGRFYVQKTASRGLKEAWDAFAGHGGTMKTLLLVPAT